ncbi:unnamed protein product, partial [Prorocentrum cordatum]
MLMLIPVAAIDTFAAVACAQPLKDKLDSMESAIRGAITASVSSAMGAATGSIAAAIAAAQASINGLSSKIEQELGLAVGQRADAARKSFQQQFGALEVANKQPVHETFEGRDFDGDVGNGSVELRVGPDKCPEQINADIIGERICQALGRAFPNRAWRVDRAKGWISANWFPVLSLTVHPRRVEATAIAYQDTGLPALGISRAQIKGAISDVVTPEVALQSQCGGEPFLPGRVLRAFFQADGQGLIFYDIHNYEINNAAVRRISTKISGDARLAKAGPSKIVLVVIGDINFAAVGELKLTTPSLMLERKNILDISSDRIKLVDSAAFEEWASALFRHGADQRRAAIDLARQRGRLPHAQARAQSQALHHKVQLWNPISKRLALTGVKTATGTVTGPTERLQKLIEHWQPVFQCKIVDTVAAEHYLDCCAPKIDFNRYQPPNVDALKRSREANATVEVFPPEGEEPDDAEHIGCRRDPSKVRVLGLRNTSLKIIGSAMNAAMAAVAVDVVPASQRGFIRRRKFGCNILELDVESRIASADPNAVTKLLVLVSRDIAQVFPSLARQFIRLALKVMGCGWSGALCAMGASCFLLDLEQKLDLRGHGLRRACADDLGPVFAAVTHLARLAGVMALVEDLAGLALKPANCRVIPLAGPLDDELVNKLRSALAVVAPRFQEFNICDRLTYLGLLLGPGATECFCLAQYVMLPRESFKVENWVNASVLRFHNGASRVKGWPRLRNWGVRAPRSMQLAQIAAIVRAATATFHKFPEIRERLHQGLDQHGDDQTLLGAARAAQHLSPPWWKAPPFVETFHQLVSAETGRRYYSSRLLARALEAARASLQAGKPTRVQRLACAAARRAMGADEIGSFLMKRIKVELPDLEDIFVNDSEVFGRVKIAMEKLPPSWAATWMRALSFSWLTSNRVIYECGRRPCIFQCTAGADNENHYLTCGPLAAAVAAATRSAVQTEAVANLALLDNSNENIEWVVVACGTYHTLRMENSVDLETLHSAARAAVRASRTMRCPPVCSVLLFPVLAECMELLRIHIIKYTYLERPLR